MRTTAPVLDPLPRKKRLRAVAWPSWLVLGLLGGDRFYLRRWLEGIGQIVLTTAALVLFLGRPTQVLLGQLGAALVGYSANLIDLNSLWQTDLAVCCFFVLAAWKLTDAANLNRLVANANLAEGDAARGRPALSRGGAAVLSGIALALGIVADSLFKGISAYVAASMSESGMVVNLFAMVHVMIGLSACYAALRAATRAPSARARWALAVPSVLVLGVFGALYWLLDRYLSLSAFAFLGAGPLSTEWLRSVAWHSDMQLLRLIRAAGSDEARLGLGLTAGLVQAGLGVAVAAVLTALAAAAAGKTKGRPE
jgi:hypothetical protein